MYTVLIENNNRVWQIVKTDQADRNAGMPTWETRENALKFIETLLPDTDIGDIRLAKLIDLQVKVEAKETDEEAK